MIDNEKRIAAIRAAGTIGGVSIIQALRNTDLGKDEEERIATSIAAAAYCLVAALSSVALRKGLTDDDTNMLVNGCIQSIPEAVLRELKGARDHLRTLGIDDPTLPADQLRPIFEGVRSQAGIKQKKDLH